MWCWRRLSRVPSTAGRSNQSLLKEINPEHSLEGLKLKLQCFGHLMPRTNSLEKTLMIGKIEGQRRRRQQRMRWLDRVTDSVHMNLSRLPERVKDSGAWHAAVHRVTKSQTWLSNWTTQSQPRIISITSCTLSSLLLISFLPGHPSQIPSTNLFHSNEKGPVYFRAYYLRLQEHACICQSRLSSPKGVFQWKTDFLQGGYGPVLFFLYYTHKCI